MEALPAHRGVAATTHRGAEAGAVATSAFMPTRPTPGSAIATSGPGVGAGGGGGGSGGRAHAGREPFRGGGMPPPVPMPTGHHPDAASGFGRQAGGGGAGAAYADKPLVPRFQSFARPRAKRAPSVASQADWLVDQCDDSLGF